MRINAVTMRRIALMVVAITGTASECAGLGQAAGATQPAANVITGEIRILPVRDSVYVLFGAGSNITVSVGRDGVLMVDAGAAEMTDKVLAAIRQLQTEAELREALSGTRWGVETRSSVIELWDPKGPPKPIRYIVNTSMDPDHTGGNVKLAGAGHALAAGNTSERNAIVGRFVEGASIIAHENVLLRMSAAKLLPSQGWPTNTYFQGQKRLSHFFNGEGIQVIHQPAAHTDGDSIVHFRRSDVIAAGDVFLTTGYPVIDLAAGGTIQGIIDALNRILDMSVTEFRAEGGTVIVPGHGRLADAADVAYYRDMLAIIRDRVQAMLAKGMTVDEVKAAKPTADYDPRYGAGMGFWTTDKFIEAVYASIKSGGPTKTAANR